jgi:hypothetical protein
MVPEVKGIPVSPDPPPTNWVAVTTPVALIPPVIKVSDATDS